MGIGFANDTIAAAMTANTLYLYNDGIGYTIDTKSGEAVRNRLTLDNYRGFYTYKGSYYFRPPEPYSRLGRMGALQCTRLHSTARPLDVQCDDKEYAIV